MKIAGQVGEITSLFESTRDYCRAYLTEEAPDFSAVITAADLAFEQEALRQEALEEGMKVRRFTDPFLDRAAIQRKFAEYLFDCGTLLFHGSTVAVGGRAYLFTAACGTGKSTHTRLWRQVFPDAVMVNDDKPFLRITDGGVFACGAPWSGKHGLDTNITVPLAGICILERGTENRIRSITPAEALPRLRHEACAPLDNGKAERFEALVAALAEKTPLWRMECTKDPQAAETACAAMSRT